MKLRLSGAVRLVLAAFLPTLVSLLGFGVPIPRTPSMGQSRSAKPPRQMRAEVTNPVVSWTMSLRPVDAVRQHGAFRITRRMVCGCAVVEVAGRLDLRSSFTLRESLISIMNSGSLPMLVDLTDVNFIDSTGLGVLAVLARHPKLDLADLAIVCPEGRVRTTLRIAGLDQVISVYPTQGQALRDEVAA